MSHEYEIGRDLQELRARVERLESELGGSRDRSRVRPSGVAEAQRTAAGVEPQKAPLVWKLHKDAELPAFVHGMLGLRPGLKLDAAQSKTWLCHPEPLILSVSWSDGGSDEFYRLKDQTFSIVRVTDPNTGVTTATASYDARLIASGKAG